MLYRRASFPTRFLAEDYLVHRYVRHISSCFERTPADLFNVSMPMFLPSLMMTAEVSPSPTPALGPIFIFICIYSFYSNKDSIRCNNNELIYNFHTRVGLII